MRYFQQKYVFSFAFLAFALVYFSLRSFSFAVDAAVCAGFTLLVFGNAIRRRGRSLIAGGDARSITEMILAHAICLVALVMVLRTGMFAPSLLPAWVNIPVGADNYGRLGPSTFQILQSLAISFLGFLEFHILIAPKVFDPEKEEKRTLATLWKKGKLDAKRMDTLRLP
jgi:hypothetical protein